MKFKSLGELFLHELKDLYDAEHQLVEALPKMAEAASNPELKAAFTRHLNETRGHVSQLEKVFEQYGEDPDRETCKAMKGLIAEGEKLIDEGDEPDVCDAALISAAQRVEHYEMAAYGTLRTWAQTLGNSEVAAILDDVYGEEEAADETLSAIAEGGINEEAAADDGDDEAEAEMEPAQSKSKQSRR